MGLYHFTAKAVSRGKGQSAVHTAAYNARDQLHDERENRDTKNYDYKGQTEFSGIFAPKDAPAWAHDREQLWNHAEAAEKRKDSQTARNVEFALPYELNAEQRRRLVTDFVRETFARRGMVADVNIHEPHRGNDDRNYHVHCLLTMRRLDGENFAAKKETAWNKKEELQHWREKWAQMGARALERAGHQQEADRFRHGHKTLAGQREAALERGDNDWAQHCDKEAQIHKGPAVSAMEERDDPRLADNEIARESRAIDERNSVRAEIRDAEKELTEARQEQEKQRAPEADNEKPRDAKPEPAFESTGTRSWVNRSATKTEEKIFFMMDGAERGGANVGTALYAAGLTLARVDAAGKLQFELDQPERTEVAAGPRNAPWMEEKGGVSALSEEHLESAQDSYSKWAEAKPDLAKKHSFENYVEYVQEQWAKNDQGKNEQRKDEPRPYRAPFREGELVTVNRWGRIERLNPRFLDLEKLEQAATGGVAKTPSLSSALEHFATGSQQRQNVHTPTGELSQAQADIRLAWSLGKGGAAFAEGLEGKGYIVAAVTAEEAYASERIHAFAKEAGNRATKYREGEIVVVNDRGAVYRLDGRTTGETEREAIDKFTATIDRANLPSVTDAKAVQKEARQASFIHEQASNKPQTWMEKKIDRLDWLAQHGDTPLRTALYNEGITLARVDASGKIDVQRDYDMKFHEARMAGDENAKPREASFVEGELVAVTKRGDVHRLNPKHIDHDRIEQIVCGQHGAQSLSAAREFFATERVADKAERQQANANYWTGRQDKRDDRAAAWEAKKEAGAKGAAFEGTVKGVFGAVPEGLGDLKDVGFKVLKAGGLTTSLGDFVDSLFGMGGKPPPANENEAQQQQRIAYHSLERIADSIERGEDLKASDVTSLMPEQLMNIKLHRDEGMLEMIEALERHREQERDYSQTRER